MSDDNPKDSVTTTVENKTDDSQASKKSSTENVELSKDEDAELTKDDLKESEERMNVDEEKDVIEAEEEAIAESRKDVVEATEEKDGDKDGAKDNSEESRKDEDVDMGEVSVKPVEEEEVKEAIEGEDEDVKDDKEEMDVEEGVAAKPVDDKDEDGKTDGKNEDETACDKEGESAPIDDGGAEPSGTTNDEEKEQNDGEKDATPMIVDEPKEMEVVMVEKDKDEATEKNADQENAGNNNVDMLALDEADNEADADKNNCTDTIEVMDMDNISPTKSKTSSEPAEDPFMTDSDDTFRNLSQTTTTSIESSNLDERESSKDTLSQDSGITDEHSIFVQDNNDKDDSDKSAEQSKILRYIFSRSKINFFFSFERS